MAPGPRPAGLHRDELVDEVTAGLTHLGTGSGVVVACSGGADSTALAFLAAEARPDLNRTLVHVSHGLRDDRVEAELVVSHAAWLGTPVRTVQVQVDARGRGLQAAARHARYAALRRVAAEIGAEALLVGHTADDQAETVLLRIARGTGVDGLAAMAPHRGDVTRPMLRIRRGDVHAFVAGEGLPYVTDPTNRDTRVARIAVRTRVLPALERKAPDVVGALARLADLARGDAELLQQVVERGPVPRDVGAVRLLERRELRSVSEALARRVVHAAVRRVAGAPPSAGTVERVLAADGPGRASLPGGVCVEVTRRWVAIAPDPDPAPPEPVVVREAGPTPWPAAERWVHRFDADAVGGAAAQPPLPLGPAGGWRPPTIDPAAGDDVTGPHRARLGVWLPAGVGELTVRAAAHGDVIADTVGHRRLVEVFRAAGLPRSVRRRWPVLVAGGVVVWVPGLAVDADLARRGRCAPVAALYLTDTATPPTPVVAPPGRRPR